LYSDIIEKIGGQPLYLVAPFMEYVPLFRRHKLEQQLKEYHEFIEEMIKIKKKKYHESSEKSKDLITAFIESNEKEAEFKLTNEEIRVIFNISKVYYTNEQNYFRIILLSLF
jgi:hypothetical protein